MDVQTQVKEPAVAQAWTDVTNLCRRAAAEMTNLAPMVHTEEFSLLDSMSAVEVQFLKATFSMHVGYALTQSILFRLWTRLWTNAAV